MHIAVLGGGLTGLVAAFHLSRRFPAAQITLLERENRLGGWVRSERVSVRDGSTTLGSVVLEAGPRTLRPNSKALLELVSRLLALSNAFSTSHQPGQFVRITRFTHHNPDRVPGCQKPIFEDSWGSWAHSDTHVCPLRAYLAARAHPHSCRSP
jgi:oxygen-dependent protoporphyrinogen oxidase